MSGALATSSQVSAAAPTPSGTIHSFFMATSCVQSWFAEAGLYPPSGSSAPRLLHLDDLDDDRVRIVVFPVRNPDKRFDDHRFGALVLRVLHEVVTGDGISRPFEDLPREFAEGLADIGWARILLLREKSQGADNPLALAPRVREKLIARGRIVDAVQVALGQRWAG